MYGGAAVNGVVTLAGEAAVGGVGLLAGACWLFSKMGEKEKEERTALRISFDDISLCNYRVIFKISLKYRYRILFENITRY